MSSPSAVKSKKGPAEAFGTDEFVVLENGQRVRVLKWSVRKAMAMGKSLANVIQQVFAAIEKRGEEDVRIADVIGMMPEIMETCADELVFIIKESLHTETGPQLTEDQVYDTLTLEDFADVLGAIIQKNVTDKMLGKWGRLLQNLPLTSKSEPNLTS